MNYEKAFDLLIDHEGGFTNNPKDRGNWTSGKIGVGQLRGTKFGISAMTYPNLDIKNLTLAHAKEIYLRDFWQHCRCDELPVEVRFDVFDMAVNSSPKAAIKNIQLAANVRADGFFGPKTKAAVECMDPNYLDKRMGGHRLLYIANIKSFPTFGRGWVVRIANNLIND